MKRFTSRAGALLLGALVALGAPLGAQSTRPTGPARSATPRPLPPGGIPKRQLPASLHQAEVQRFQRSFQLSLDRVHWGTSISTMIPCPPGTGAGAPCERGVPPVRVFARWAPLPDTVDMKQVHITGITGPYTVRLTPLSGSRVCQLIATYPLPTTSLPLTIDPTARGGPMPITCTWAVYAVVPQPPGSPQPYLLMHSNTATVVVRDTATAHR